VLLFEHLKQLAVVGLFAELHFSGDLVYLKQAFRKEALVVEEIVKVCVFLYLMDFLILLLFLLLLFLLRFFLNNQRLFLFLLFLLRFFLSNKGLCFLLGFFLSNQGLFLFLIEFPGEFLNQISN
jgi:hypothetical protein